LSNLRDSLLPCVDKILSVRDDIGVTLHEVFLIERTWSGKRVGAGSFNEESQKISPSPRIVDIGHDVRVVAAGSVKSGDLMLTGISRNQYPDELTLRTDTVDRNVEKLYKVGKHFYRVVHIKEKLLTWDLHIRKVRKDETEER